jgi:competence protein ComEA
MPGNIVMQTNGGAHACNTYRLVVLLLFCAIPATVQYSRLARRHTPALTTHPPRVIYELRGDVRLPGIYRFEEEQTSAALAKACGGAHETAYTADGNVASGTRLLFNQTETASTVMDAAILFSYFLPISLTAASAENLEMIPGIGPKTARALFDYHKQAGPIKNITQLINVRGIGPKTLEKIARYLKP